MTARPMPATAHETKRSTFIRGRGGGGVGSLVKEGWGVSVGWYRPSVGVPGTLDAESEGWCAG